MKRREYGKIHNLVSDEDWENHFIENLSSNKFPVAITSCLVCDEIVDDNFDHKCRKEEKRHE